MRGVRLVLLLGVRRVRGYGAGRGVGRSERAGDTVCCAVLYWLGASEGARRLRIWSMMEKGIEAGACGTNGLMVFVRRDDEAMFS